MDRAEFQEALLTIMEQKRDPAWSRFTGGHVPADRLHVHLEQEYEDALRSRYELRTCARPWRCLRQRRMRIHFGRTCVTWKAMTAFIRTA